MLVFGDRSRRVEPRSKAAELRAASSALAHMPPGISRHAAIAELFLSASELAQGIADAEFEEAGEDRLTPAQVALGDLLQAVARSLIQSWGEAFVSPAPELSSYIRRLCALALQPVDCRRQEGYAFYALYPESYALAAQPLQKQAGAVIGIRSIGVGLGAIVAAATAAPVSISVRPIGPPFRRRLVLGADLRAAIVARARRRILIADEGPGLSGSSFAAAAETVEALGVNSQRIDFFPSHNGAPGLASGSEIQALWSRARKHVQDFESLLLHPRGPHHRLGGWCEEITGPALGPLEDIGAGKWRRYWPGDSPPPARPRWERRKFLLRSERGTFLLRFAGLGRYGAETLDRAQLIAGAGFSPPVLGLRHGFLIEKWITDAKPLDHSAVRRADLVAHLGAYLGFRARRLAAAPGSGASLSQLAAMLTQNTGEALGVQLSKVDWLSRAESLEPRVRRAQTDNRLHLWEWLQAADGRLLKTDAYDHCDAHDLIGCQDIAWDVAGAACEFDLSGPELDSLLRRLSWENVAIDRDLLHFFKPCYLAFQFAAHQLAASELSSEGAMESSLTDLVESYKRKLDLALFAPA